MWREDTALVCILVSVNPRPNNTFFESEPGGREAAPGSLALVQAFVNTREAERGWDELADPDSLRRWLVQQGLVAGGDPIRETVTEADVLRSREVREALRALLFANNGGAVDPWAIESLNRVSGRSKLEVSFGADGQAVLEPASDGPDGALGKILAAVHNAMERDTWKRLKACANEGCTWVFYDRSKNRSGEWCSMAVCGNRAKTRSYRRRRAEAL